jgi:predicted transcriptional regulator
VSDQLHPSTLAACTTEIVAAFVASHTVANADLPQLIDLVARNLTMLGAAPGLKPNLRRNPKSCPDPFKGHRFPREIISYAFWLYYYVVPAQLKG